MNSFLTSHAINFLIFPSPLPGDSCSRALQTGTYEGGMYQKINQKNFQLYSANSEKKEFPKLQNAGGFEFLRCIPNSRTLELISATVARLPQLLKSVVELAMFSLDLFNEI